MKEQLRPSEEEAKEPIPKDNESWIRDTSSFVHKILHNPNWPPIPERLDFPLPRRSEWLREHHKILKIGARMEPRAFERFHQRRRRSIIDLVERIEHKQRHDLLLPMIQGIESITNSTAFMIYGVEMATAYCLLCPPDRLLASVKGKVCWKRIAVENYSPAELEKVWQAIPFAMIGPLPYLDPQNIDMIPDRFIHPEALSQISIPKTAKTISELLEEAFYNQRYVVPPEGAVVHLQRAGDLKQIVIKERDGNILAKTRFAKGEGLVIINLDSALISSSSTLTLTATKDLDRDSLSQIVAEVYRDLVTAIEIPVLDTKRNRRVIAQTEPTDREYTYVYIPRIIRVRGKEERPPYESPERPTRPHVVTGHLRKVPMTPEHRKVLEEFEQKTGMRVLEFIPEGNTFVRPHISPTIALELLDRLPQFIKRKLEESIKKQMAKKEPTVVYQSS